LGASGAAVSPVSEDGVSSFAGSAGGQAEFDIPRDFGAQLFDFQTAAIKIVAHHVNVRNGVVLGDVGIGENYHGLRHRRYFPNRAVFPGNIGYLSS
jgi:hypothetical protein